MVDVSTGGAMGAGPVPDKEADDADPVGNAHARPQRAATLGARPGIAAMKQHLPSEANQLGDIGGRSVTRHSSEESVLRDLLQGGAGDAMDLRPGLADTKRDLFGRGDSGTSPNRAPANLFEESLNRRSHCVDQPTINPPTSTGSDRIFRGYWA